MYIEKHRYNACLAGYFSVQLLFFDGDKQKKPNVRKCVELPFQQTKAELWDEVTDTLCNLDFIQAKAVAKMTYDLIADFNAVLQVIPDNAENIREENQCQARMDKYTQDLIAYAKGEIAELEIPETAPLSCEKKISSEIERIKTNPTRADKLKDFLNFLGKEAGNLQNYALEFSHFATQQAWNYAAEGPVGKAAEKAPSEMTKSLLLRDYSTRPPWNPLHKVLQTLRAHTRSVNAVSITPDGLNAISGSDDHTCIIWDLKNGRALQILKGHTSCVKAVSITPDGQRAISGSLDHTCIIWDLNTGQAIQTLRSHTGWVNAVSITPDGQRAISGSADSTCILWDLGSGQALYFLRGHTKSVRAVSITSNGQRAISGSEDNTCIIWDLGTGQAMQILRGHSKPVMAVSITPDGQRAISGDKNDDDNCILWDLKKGQTLQILSEYYHNINAISITPDGQRAISGSFDTTCILWDLKSGQASQILTDHSKDVNAVSITADGQKAISGSNDNTCILWDLGTGQALQTQIGQIGWTILSITPDGQNVISRSGNTWNRKDLRTGKLLQTLREQKGSVFSWIHDLSITPDGLRAISGCEDNTCTLWNLGTGQSIQTLKGHTEPVIAVSITSDGQRAISGSFDKTCILWDLKTGQALQTLRGHTDQVTAISITLDGQRAISGSRDSTCILWDLETGKALRTFQGHSFRIGAISFTPDGKGVISGSNDGNCILWDLRTGQALQILKGHTDQVNSVSISPDGQKVFSCSWDYTCILWDLGTGKKLACFTSDSYISAQRICANNVLLGCESRVVILNTAKNLLCSGSAITTTRQIWDFELQKYRELSADCPLCGHRFAPPASILATIDIITRKAGLRPEQSPCLELPKKAWEEPGLLGNCPKCGGELKFNPFIAGGDN